MTTQETFTEETALVRAEAPTTLARITRQQRDLLKSPIFMERYSRLYKAFCLDGECPSRYPPSGALSENPKFRWAQAHTRKQGHRTLIGRTEEWVFRGPRKETPS